jgi:hypothetical protein
VKLGGGESDLTIPECSLAIIYGAFHTIDDALTDLCVYRAMSPSTHTIHTRDEAYRID